MRILKEKVKVKAGKLSSVWRSQPDQVLGRLIECADGGVPVLHNNSSSSKGAGLVQAQQ